jgi:hypothetical protein
MRYAINTMILLVLLHSIEICCGREPLDGFDGFAAKALDAFDTPGMSVAGGLTAQHGYAISAAMGWPNSTNFTGRPAVV